ncbi:MAG: MBL fold metallo-hydrolase [Deltaproteobacteria bacterium]|nr:MBL fold metallo-hydrolase [Deltaproteobacteria bacterium]
MLFRQLFDARSFTYTYLLADPASRAAVLIDPVFEQVTRDQALLRELGLHLVATLDTHVHADHVTGAFLHRAALGCRIVVSRHGGTTGHDDGVDDGDRVAFGARSLGVRATPGHTDGCVTYVLDDLSLAFTGDALLIRGAGRTDFQQGDARTLFRSVREKIFTLPDDTLLYPGHDYAGRTVTTVAEERAHNPRLGGERSEGDFVLLMGNLHLPHPKQLALALPANLRVGAPDAPMPPSARPDWAEVTRSYAGVPELRADAFVAEPPAAKVVDLREDAELRGELGRIPAAVHQPLGGLLAAAASWDREAPLVLVCRSGGRSAQAAVQLEGLGFRRVASLLGGMLAYRVAGGEVIREASG